MTRAAIDDTAAVAPHRARPRVVVERVWRYAESHARATTAILTPITACQAWG
jgi:hypothetical protein